MDKGNADSTAVEGQDSDCACFNPPFNFQDFTEKFIGVDETHGRFGDVSVDTCKHCGTRWLRYHVVYEGFSESGRWYRGLVSDEQLAEITPQTAVEFLESLPWRFYGGSYFRTSGRRGEGPVHVGL